MEIKTRRQAAEAGEKKYYTGRPCIHGHDGPRYTSSGICCACNIKAMQRYNQSIRTQANATAAGLFTYRCHPDDHAALLAYAQALDIQRGRVPQMVPPAPDAPFDAAAARAIAFGKVVDDMPAPTNYVPAP